MYNIINKILRKERGKYFMKFKIHDEDGSTFEIEEIKDDEIVETDPVDEPIVDENVNALTPEEVSALKALAAVADKLMAIIPAEKTDEVVEEEVVEDADPVVTEEETEEEVIDTKSCDSKKSFGSVEKKVKDAKTSISVEDAWQKRYGGGNL